jgi:hypothetical protein
MIERRQEPRAQSVFRSAYVRTHAGLQFVTLRNISECGVCIDAFPGVVEGEEIDLCIDSAGLRQGMVRWITDGLCGIVFTSEGQQEVHHPQYRPRSVRLPLSVGVQLYIDGRGNEAILRNISIRGACISSRSDPATGQLVSLSICGFHFELATVRWVQQGLFGLRFSQPIHPATFRELVIKIQQSPEIVLDPPRALSVAHF